MTYTEALIHLSTTVVDTVFPPSNHTDNVSFTTRVMSSNVTHRSRSHWQSVNLLQPPKWQSMTKPRITSPILHFLFQTLIFSSWPFTCSQCLLSNVQWPDPVSQGPHTHSSSTPSRADMVTSYKVLPEIFTRFPDLNCSHSEQNKDETREHNKVFCGYTDQCFFLHDYTGLVTTKTKYVHVGYIWYHRSVWS